MGIDIILLQLNVKNNILKINEYKINVFFLLMSSGIPLLARKMTIYSSNSILLFN